MSAMIKRLEARVSGRVQMVMFRDFVKRRARRLGLTGWVKNETSGDVTVVAEGEEEKLRSLLSHMGRGSLLSRVERVEDTWPEPRGEFKNFVIRYN